MSISLSEDQLKQIISEAVASAVTTAVSSLGTASSTASSGSTTATPFHLVPGGDAADTNPWNFTTKEGLTFFQAATKGLFPKYDGDPEKLPYFLDRMQDRADEYGFSNVLEVCIATDDNRKLTTEYGSMTQDQIETHAKTYIDKENRKRQGSRIIISLLKNSIENELLDELKTKNYKIKVTVNTTDTYIEDGAMMLYQFINLVAVNTRSTIATILKTLTGTGLSAMVEEVKSDIKQFNKKVNLLMISLRARRREVPDIVPALFEAYATAADTKFVEYIRRKEEEYEDNSIADLSNTKLMNMALEKYKTLVEKKAWGQKSKEELEFMALKTELEEAKRKLTMKPKDKDSKKTDKKQGPKNEGEWAWKAIAPKPNEPHYKKFRGREYIFCPHHGDTKWVLKVNAQGIEHETGCREKAKHENEQVRKTNALVAASKSLKALDNSDAGTTSTAASSRDEVIAKALATVLGDNLDMSVLTEDEDIAAPPTKQS